MPPRPKRPQSSRSNDRGPADRGPSGAGPASRGPVARGPARGSGPARGPGAAGNAGGAGPSRGASSGSPRPPSARPPANRSVGSPQDGAPRGKRPPRTTRRDDDDDEDERDDRRSSKPGVPYPKSPDLSSARARNVAIVVFDMMRHTFETRRPADRELSSLFRSEKKYGSSDRRIISETLYSTFRWWGWMRQLIRDESRFFDRDGLTACEDPTWLMILLGAHLLDVKTPHPVALRWRDILQEKNVEIRHVDGLAGRSLHDQADLLTDQLALDTRLRWQDLTPGWLFAHLPLRDDDRRRLIEALQSRPPLWLRDQSGDGTDLDKELRDAGLDPQRDPRIAAALKLVDARVNLFELDAFKNGRVEVQDLASQVIGRICDARPGQRWWDVCAGAGGKSLQLASTMNNKGLIVATDIRDYKLDDLKKRARRGDFHNITTREFTGTGIPSKKPTFDGVLVDAPCTCTGTWRRNPDARWTTLNTDIDEMAATQYKILENASAGVKPGGSLVYATCSVTETENEGIVVRFLTAHPEYELESFVHPLTGETVTGMVRVWPWEGDCDATFVTRMKRSATPAEPKTPKTPKVAKVTIVDETAGSDDDADVDEADEADEAGE